MPSPMRTSFSPGLDRKISRSLRHAVTTRSFAIPIPPPSIGHAFNGHVPVPSFSGFEKTAPSRDRVRYMSREPPSAFRHITRIRPEESIATDGWQHSQMVPSGES